MTDETLMHAFIAGDIQAFEQLFERHAPALRAMFVRRTRNRALAADLTQTAFLSVVRGRGRFVAGSKFKPWLYAIALNAFRDDLRRSKREVPAEPDALLDECAGVSSRDPIVAHEVWAALDTLPAGQREAVVLNRFLGFGFAEIARMLGQSETAVKVRAHRARARLKALLEELWSDHE